MVEITTKHTGDILKLTVVGEIDASSSIDLDNALKTAMNDGRHILVNMESLEYISSAGLGVFISYIEEFKKTDIQMVIYGCQEKVVEVFNILGLQKLIIMVSTEQEAIELLNGK